MGSKKTVDVVQYIMYVQYMNWTGISRKAPMTCKAQPKVMLLYYVFVILASGSGARITLIRWALPIMIHEETPCSFSQETSMHLTAPPEAPAHNVHPRLKYKDKGIIDDNSTHAYDRMPSAEDLVRGPNQNIRALML